jgi:hypothetical protein
MISSTLIKLASAAFAAALLAGSAGSAFAESQWDANHPWRDQVNDRLHNQDRRIDQERREGELGRGQARQLHRDDHRIRQEERRMASRDHGHLTRADHRILNHQENRISHRIGR